MSKRFNWAPVIEIKKLRFYAIFWIIISKILKVFVVICYYCRWYLVDRKTTCFQIFSVIIIDMATENKRIVVITNIILLPIHILISNTKLKAVSCPHSDRYWLYQCAYYPHDGSYQTCILSVVRTSLHVQVSHHRAITIV